MTDKDDILKRIDDTKQKLEMWHERTEELSTQVEKFTQQIKLEKVELAENYRKITKELI